MGFWIQSIIREKLQDICPTLDLDGEDRKVFQLCLQDFTNYVAYLNKTYMQVDTAPLQQSLGGQESPLTEVDVLFILVSGDASTTLKQRNVLDRNEVLEFIDIWIKMWWKKWLQRTKVIFNDKDMPKNPVAAGPLPVGGFGKEESDELKKACAEKLIQYGEICCTNILADALFKKAIAEKPSWKLEDKLALISRLQREAKIISYTHGPLVFIRPDNYFKLREWRNDASASDRVS
jgi:hypothetical protein